MFKLLYYANISILIIFLFLHQRGCYIQSIGSGWGGTCGTIRVWPKMNLTDYRTERTRLSQNRQGQPISETQAVIDYKFRRERIHNEFVIVRLSVAYDDSFKSQFEDPRLREDYIRAIIFETQLYYERPEMTKHIKFNLVVVEIRELNFKLDPSMDADKLLDVFTRSNQNQMKIDMNILLLFRNMWVPGYKLNRRDDIRGKILGLSYIETFCRFNRPSLCLNANSIGSSAILTHELSHSLGSKHDGEPGYHESRCANSDHLMHPNFDPRRLSWSRCTIDVFLSYLTSDQVYNCIFSSNRLGQSKPIKHFFDFTPIGSNSNRLILPGHQFNIDQQCKLALGQMAISLETKIGMNGDKSYDVCKNLLCRIEGSVGPSEYVDVEIGPAASGSVCRSRSNKSGRCFHQECT